MATDAADGNYYVVVSLLADPKGSHSRCTPHPTTLTSTSPPPPPPSVGVVDLESSYLFSLLDQEEETHIVHSSSSPSFEW